MSVRNHLITSGVNKPAGGGGDPVVTWTGVDGFAVSSPNITRDNTGNYAGEATSVQTINASGGVETKFKFFLLEETSFQIDMYIGASGGSPYSGAPNAAGVRVYLGASGSLTVAEWTGAAYTYQTDFTLTEADEIWMGFTTGNNLRVWKGGSAQWTSAGTYSGTQVLVVTHPNEVTYNGLVNVRVV